MINLKSIVKILSCKAASSKTAYTGAGCRVPRTCVAALQIPITDAGNHRAVVGAQFKRRENAAYVASFGEHAAQARIGGNTAAGDYRF